MTAVATPPVHRASTVARPPHGRLLRGVSAVGFGLVLVMWWVDVPAGASTTPAALATTLGELTGLAGAYLVCAQVLLIARIPWFERAVGLDRLVPWHRWLGTTVILLVLAHVALMVAGTELLDASLPWTALMAVLTDYPDMLTALVGTILFIAVGLSSARLLRQRLSYEVWWVLHLTTYLAIFLTFFHQLSGGTHFVANPVNRIAWIALYLGTAAALITWRLLLPTARAWRHRLRVEAVVPESEGMVSVWFSGPRVRELGAEAGSFLLVRFLARGHLLTAHPYSVSRLPHDGYLRITVGALGDHSILVSRLKPGTLTFVEGPFGRFTADRATRSRVLLVAGGAGIGPIRALAEEFVGRGVQPLVLYRARSPRHLALLGELQLMPGVTVVPSVGRRSELGYDPLAPAALATLLPQPHEWEVFVCGPEGMMQTAEASLRALGVPKRFIHREELSMS